MLPTLAHTLTPERIAAAAGASLLCLAKEGEGRPWMFYAARPSFDAARDAMAPTGTEPYGAQALVSTVRLFGPLLQRSGPQGECGAWADGYDAFAERMLAAFAIGNVHLLVDSPGGVLTGLPECVDLLVVEKARTGRKVHVTVVGMCDSAAYALACSVADPGEFYLTRSSEAGSIGVKARHRDTTGNREKDGFIDTEIAFPPGKTAISDGPLGAEGRALVDEGIMDGFVWFASAVEKARPNLTRAAVEALKGYTYTGDKAVGAGLVDAVAAVDEVQTLALAQAARDAESAQAQGERVMSLRAEGPPPPKDGEPPESTRTATRPETKCASCGTDNPPAHKFCAQCGKSMAAQPMEKDDPPDSDEAKRAAARSRVSVESLSMPALKARVLDMEAMVADIRGAAEGKRSRTALGAIVETLATDAAKAPRYRTERNDARAALASRERMDLLHHLVAAKVHTAGEVFEPIVNADGTRTGTKPTAEWGAGPEGRTLANLRMYTERKLAGAPAAAASPFAPNPAAALAEKMSGAKPSATNGDIEMERSLGVAEGSIAKSRAALVNPDGSMRV